MARALGGAPRLIGTKVFPSVRACLMQWGHPLAPVCLAEWLRLCAVQSGYAARKSRRLQEFRSFIESLPGEIQSLPLPQQVSMFVGNLLIRPSIRSPATISTYVAELAAALGISKKTKILADTLAGVNRMWLYHPHRAEPVSPPRAVRAAGKLGPQEKLLAAIWISNGLRQSCLEHMLFEPSKVECHRGEGETVLVILADRRKGLATWQAPRAEVRMVGPERKMEACRRALAVMLASPLETKLDWFATLEAWRRQADFAAHGIRRGTAQWMAQRGSSREVVSQVLGHAEEVRRFPVTQLYTEGQTLAERLALARAQPRTL